MVIFSHGEAKESELTRSGEMKTKARLFIIVLSMTIVFFPGKGFAQTVADLEKKLETVSGKEKIELLNQLAKKNTFNSPKKSITFGEQALELSRALKDRKGEAAALRNIGAADRILGNHDKTLDYYQKALTIYKSLKDKKGTGSLLHNIGILYWNLSDYPKALEYLKKSLAIAEELDFKTGIASSLNIIGVIHDDLSNFDKALEYYLKSMKLYEEMGNKKGYAILLNNVGIVYRKLNRLDKARDYYEKAIKIEKELGNNEGVGRGLNNLGVVYESLKEYPKALDYYLRALKIKKEAGNKQKIASSLMNIGNVYTRLEEYDNALECYRESLKIRREIGEKKGMCNTLKNLGKFYTKQGNYGKALTYLEQCLIIAKEIDSKAELNDTYYNLSELYSQQKDYKKALDYFKRHTDTKDEILNKESNDKIAEMQVKYETEKKKKEITLLEKNNELLHKNNKIQELTLSREKFKTNAFTIGFVLVLIIGLLLFKKYLYLFAFWKKKNYIGHYRILEEIGSGGMGIVYKASPVMEKEKTVALKVIRDEYSQDPIHRKRFMNEAQLVDQLDHPNIVKVYERGESDRHLFIAMEMLHGRSLAEIIGNNERIPLNHCFSLMSQLVDAVAKIHSRGIVHRDLKPENIMIVDSEEKGPAAKLLDFGLAKTHSLTRLTETGEILGTINYLPPERISHQDFSAAGDIYSLGVVFYEMVTVEKPFLGETPIDIIKQILEKDPVEPSRFRPELPGALSILIMGMMNKVPEKRPTEKMVLNEIAAIHGN